MCSKNVCDSSLLWRDKIWLTKYYLSCQPIFMTVYSVVHVLQSIQLSQRWFTWRINNTMDSINSHSLAWWSCVTNVAWVDQWNDSSFLLFLSLLGLKSAGEGSRRSAVTSMATVGVEIRLARVLPVVTMIDLMKNWITFSREVSKPIFLSPCVHSDLVTSLQSGSCIWPLFPRPPKPKECVQWIAKCYKLYSSTFLLWDSLGKPCKNM